MSKYVFVDTDELRELIREETRSAIRSEGGGMGRDAGEGSKLLSSAGAAKWLKITTRQLYTLRQSGKIPFTMVGREYRYPSEGINKYLSERYVPTRNEKPRTADEGCRG